MVQVASAATAVRDSAACGCMLVKPWNAPGHTCSSAWTPAAHSLLAYATVSSRNTSALPQSMYVGGSPDRSSARAGAAYGYTSAVARRSPR